MDTYSVDQPVTLWELPQDGSPLYGYSVSADTGMRNPFPGIIFWVGLIPCLAFGALAALAGRPVLASAVPAGYVVLTMFIAPQISLYVFMAWQAWDGILIMEKDAVLTPAKVLAFVVIVACMIHLGRTRRASRTSRTVFALMLVYVAYSLATSFVAIAPLAAVRYGLQILVLVTLVYLGLRVIDTPHRARSIVHWLVLGTTVAAGVTLVGGQSSQFSRATLGEYMNPNTTATAIALAIVALPAYWSLAQKPYDRLICILVVPVLALGVLKTGSRSAIGGVAVAFMVGILFASGENKARKALLFGAVAVLLAVAVGVAFENELLPERAQTRIESWLGLTSVEAIQGSRWEVWSESLHAWIEHQPVFGLGMGNTAFARLQQTGMFQDVHSSLLGPLVDGGVLGALLFWSLLLYLAKKVWDGRRSEFRFPLAVLFVFLGTACVAHTIHYTKWFWIPVFLILMLLKLVEDRQQDEFD